MQVFINQAIGVDQGDDVLFSDYEDGGTMWTGSGARERRKMITFATEFKDEPVVHVSMSLWDMDSATNARADVTAEKITRTGFDVVFRTWSDTRVARVRVRWLAIGAAFHEDDWQDVY
ncbi:H-type lectin domain-containing protein [Roseovarius tolerans]|uniref:H-type lectin domain-containing protein n=1 Tax=Roseovarius tolerans TaxID=74031 RepID=A0A1H8A3H9_9RHOB|nr:H-type lectin domain-containing protein [Roseovarius tolerans]SEM65305.1 H-type lectin domain-containing protein [Roseovarius tolerans]